MEGGGDIALCTKKREDMNYRIIWKNTATKEVFLQVSEDMGTVRFYRFLLPMGLTPGEYEYYITSADGTLSLNENDIRLSSIDGVPIVIYDCGVAQAGQIMRSDVEYNPTKTYKQYGAA